MHQYATSGERFHLNHIPISGTIRIAAVLALTLTLLTAQSVHAQTFSYLHLFNGGSDGANPVSGVTVGGGGTLYGTASGGGSAGDGTVYKLTLKHGGWVLDPLWEFAGGNDGAVPYAGVVAGSNGALYGTTYRGGGTLEYGIVYELRPPATACKTAICYWNETIIHSFTGPPNDGSTPYLGKLIFDSSGNMYGTTYEGGTHSEGNVYEFSPQSGGGWTESILYNFDDGTDGGYPVAGVIESAGALYGTNFVGGTGSQGVLYQLTPAGPPWTEETLANFGGSAGYQPYATPIVDQSGNLYGTTESGGPGDSGTVYEVSQADGSWSFSSVYVFGGSHPACNPYAGVTLGANGNLFGVCQAGGANNDGWVFEMPTTCNDTCTPTDLYDFTGSAACLAQGPVTFDSSGNLYGTCYGGGNTGSNCNQAYGCGSVWELEGVLNLH